MAYTAEDLPELVGKIVDAAIEAQLSWFGMNGTVDGGFEGTDAGRGIHISPLGGHYNGSTFEKGGQVTDPFTGTPTTLPIPPGWPFDSLQGLIDYYTTEIHEMFRPWITRPRPADFDGAVQATYNAAKAIAATGNPNPKTGDAWDPAVDLYTSIDVVNTNVAGFRGEAMWHLQQDVTARIPHSLEGLGAVTSVLYAAAHGEAEAWKSGADGLADIMVKSIDAMKASDISAGGGGDIVAILNIVGGLSAILGPLTLGATSAAFAIAGTVLQTSKDFIPERKQQPVPLSADNPVGVLTNIRQALEKLSDDIATEETAIQSMVRTVSRLPGWENGTYDLAEPRILQHTDPAYFEEIQTDADELRRIATAIETEISPVLTGAATQLDGATEFAPWQRPSGMGLGTYGGWGEYSYLVGTVTDTLRSSAAYLDHSADVVRLIARSFTMTDAAIRTGLEQIAGEVERDPAIDDD